jgi:hypothetical protein
LGSAVGRSEAKAFYRLLSNEKFDMAQLQDISSGSALARMSGTVLLIQDTSSLNFNGHKKTAGLGYCDEYNLGINLHSCIALSPEGIPFGLVSQSYETRHEPKNTLTKAERSARHIEEKESYHWIDTLKRATAILPDGVHFVTICDREGDFYELYAAANELGEDFIIRVIHDRRCESNEKAATKIRQTAAASRVRVNIPRDSRKGVPARVAEMEVAYCRVDIKRPSNVLDTGIARSLAINLVRITELKAPDGQEAIEWILATSLPLSSASDAMRIVEYYIQRWKIERFHYVLKSGCNAEKIQQRTYERIKPVLLIYSVIAMFIMTLTYIGRILPDTPCDLFFDDEEWKILYRVIHKTKLAPDKPYGVAEAIEYLARLGGYKRAPSDGPPGLQCVWRGLFALFFAVDIFVGQG